MICVKTCMLSSVILFWFICGMLMNKKTPEYTNLMNSLSTEQKDKFAAIVKERTHIFKIASVVSCMITLAVLYNLKGKRFSFNKHVCIFIVSFVFLMSLIYMTYPKSDYMIRHLSSQEQRDAWVNMKTNMGLKKYFGLGIGIFVYSLFSIV